MDASEQAVAEALRLARKADEQAERLLFATPQDERDAAWAETLSQIVREARVALRAALTVATSVAILAEADQAEMRLRLHGWRAVHAGCDLESNETLPGD